MLCLLTAGQAAAQSITIAWDPNTEPDVAGYMVHYGTTPDRYDGIVDVGPQTTWQLLQTAPGNTYYFRVLAYTLTGLRSNLSQQVSETIPAAAVSSPAMSLDIPLNSSTVSQNFVIGGWAADLGATAGSGVDVVHVWAYPNPGSGQAPFFVGGATLGVARPDVAAAFGQTRLANSGFMLSTTLTPAVYDVVAFARSTVSGTFNNARMARVTVIAPQSRPTMWVDLPRADATVRGRFRVAGWALDLGASTGTGVDAIHVWAYPNGGSAPIFIGASQGFMTRTDIATAFGSSRFAPSGFDFVSQTQLTAGTYDIAVYARSKVTGTFNNWKRVRVVVQ